MLREALFKAFERKRLTASGTEPAPNNVPVGLTIPRPVVVKEARYCGKEIVVDESEAPADEGLTPEELNATVALEYKKPAVHEACRLLAESRDRGAAIASRARVHRSTIVRVRKGQKPRGSTTGKILDALQRGHFDYNALRREVREAGVEEVARYGVSRRTLYRFLTGRKPGKSSGFGIICALWRMAEEREAPAA